MHMGNSANPYAFSYIQASALAFTAKLNIEIHLAELLGKVVKQSSRPKSSLENANVEACPGVSRRGAGWSLQKLPVKECKHEDVIASPPRVEVSSAYGGLGHLGAASRGWCLKDRVV